MKRCLIAYVVLAVLFPAFDFAWIGGVARRLYQTEIGPLLAPQPRLAAAATFYGIYAAGVLIFAVAPNLDRDWRRAAAMAALFGLAAYATYDLTNLATLRGFTLTISLADMAWGVAMTTVVAGVGRVAALRLG